MPRISLLSSVPVGLSSQVRSVSRIRHNSTSSSGGSSSASPSRPCPKCSTPVPVSQTPCPNCTALLPLPSSLSLHSVLGLSNPVASTSAQSSSAEPFDVVGELRSLPGNGYAVDNRDLRGRMLRKQNQLHPDKFAQDGERVVSLARELSGRVNEAYATLSNPLKRAEYLLSKHSQATEESDSLTDPTLLMEILEAREELEFATTEEEVDSIRKINKEKVESTIQSLTAAFSADPPDFAAAKDLAIQLKYWQGLEDAAKEWSPRS